MATTPQKVPWRRGSGHHQLTGLGKPVRFTFDNVLYPASGNAHVDSIGILLYLTSPIGTSLAHVYYTGVTAENPAGYVVDAIDPNEPRASTSPVPEPSTLWVDGGLAWQRWLGRPVVNVPSAGKRRRFARQREPE